MQNSLRLATLLVLALALTACGGDDPPADTTPSGTAAGSTATSAPTEPGTPEASRTPFAGAPDGFEVSCASAFAWDEPLPFDFACIDEPRPSVVLSGVFEAHGYAASAAGTLIIEVRDPSGVAVGSQPVEFAADGPGRLAPWQTTMAVPTNVPPGAAIVAIYFEAADGSHTGEATSEVVVEPEFD